MTLDLIGFAEAMMLETENPVGLRATMHVVRAAYVATMSRNKREAARLIVTARDAVRISRLPNQRKLNRILDAIGDVDVLTARLLALGIRIHAHERYTVAVDIFDCVYDMSDDVETKLHAVYRRAFALRMAARFEEAAASYSTLELDAAKAGNDHMMLQARLGHAKLAINKGNLPDAVPILERVIRCATYMHDGIMLGKALLDRAAVAGMSKDPRSVIRFGTEAMKVLPEGTDRNRAGLNVALALRETERHGEAKARAICVRDRAVGADERGLAVALLYHLATDEDDAEGQAECHEELAQSTSPLVVIERYECIGRAMAARGDFAGSRAAYEMMLDLAQQYRYGEPAHCAEQAIRLVRWKRVPPFCDYNPPRLVAVAGRVDTLTTRSDVPGAGRVPLHGRSVRV